MDKVLSYKILPAQKIIIEYLEGKATWLDYLEMKKKEIAEENYNGTYNVITDISDIETTYSREMEKDILTYIHYMEQEKIELNHYTSIITKSPSQYLHSEFLKKHSIKLNIKVQTYSTFEAAFRYVQLYEEHIDIVLDTLKSMRVGKIY